MKRVWTKSGSVYEIDLEAKTWRRPTAGSSNLRTQEGTFINDPEITIGLPIKLICPPLVEEFDGRAIVTTAVTQVEDVE